MCEQCYDDDHEFVGMDVCIYCGECKSILLQTKFNANGKPAKGLHRTQATSPEPCDKCKEKFNETGMVPMIEAHPDEKTGQPIFGNRYVFIKKTALGKEFQDFAKKYGYIICDHETMNQIMKGNENEKN